MGIPPHLSDVILPHYLFELSWLVLPFPRASGDHSVKEFSLETCGKRER